MALVYTVSQLLEMSLDSVPEAFTGKVKSVYRANTGTNKQGNSYSLQKLVITDGAADIEVMLDGRDELPRSVEGQKIYVMAGRGEKGLKGTKRKENTYKNKTTQQVWVYDSADVTFEGGASSTAPTQSNGSSHAPNNGANGRGSTTNGTSQSNAANGNGGHPPANGSVDRESARAAAIKDFNLRLGKASSALSRCFDAAIQVIEGVNTRHQGIIGKPTPELLEKVAMGLLVNTCWTAKPSDIEGFPTRPFQTYEQATQNTDGNQPPNGSQSRQRQGAPFNA